MQVENLVSVVIPVYNVENYLEQCIESVLNQTYRNIEIILIDDGSTDNSPYICDSYGKEYDYIRVVHKKNEGLGMARNTGLEMVKGNYVYFFDSDDYLNERQIEQLVSAINKEQADVCYVGFIATNNEGVELFKRSYNDEVFRGVEIKNKLIPRLIGSAPNVNDSIEMSAAAQLYSMDVIRNNNIRFVSERNLISEDLVFNLDFLEMANCAVTISSVSNYYRKNPESLSHTYLFNRFEKSRDFYRYIYGRLISMNAPADTLNRAHKAFFINIRMSIKQEVMLNSEKSKQKKIETIKNICSDKDVKMAIRDYPTSKLGIKQRLFLFFVQTRMANVLYYLMKYIK